MQPTLFWAATGLPGRIATMARPRGGTLVDTRDQADTIFAPDTGVTPFDSDRIVADYL